MLLPEEKLREALVIAPTAAAAKSALAALRGLANDTDFDAIRALTRALAGELGYDANSAGFLHAQSISEFLDADDIPPLLRIHAVGFWPHKLLNDSAQVKELGEKFKHADSFRRFQLLVQRDAPVQHELLEAHVLGAFVLLLSSGLTNTLMSSGNLLHIMDQIRGKCRVIEGMNADTSFSFGRELILKVSDLSGFFGVVFHELGHFVFDSAMGQRSQYTDALPMQQDCAELGSKLPVILKSAAKLQGKSLTPTDARRYRNSRGLTLLCTYLESPNGQYTHFSVTNNAGPIELQIGAMWAYFILSMIGTDLRKAAAAYSPRGVFHFGFVGLSDARMLRQRKNTVNISDLVASLGSGSANWLDELSKASRLGHSGDDVPAALGVTQKEPRFYGLLPQITWTDRQICVQLHDHPIRPDATSENLDDLLCLTVRCSDPASVRIVLAAGASGQARLPDGQSCVKEIGQSLCVVRDQNGKTYYGPSRKDVLEVVDILVSAGLNLNEPLDNDSNTLLHSAAGRNLELAQFLLSHGATVDAANKHGRTPLFSAVSYGPLTVVQELLRAGADAKRKDNTGKTPLHCAVEYNEEQRVALLLQHGVSVDAATYSGETPLMLAASLGLPGIVGILLDKGADPEAANSRGETPIHRAVSSWRVDAELQILQALLSAGADIDEETNEGETPLMLTQSMDIVKFLLSRGANVNAVDINGNTPLLLLLKSQGANVKDVVEELLKHGADVLHVNEAGESPTTLGGKGTEWAELSEFIAQAARKARKEE